MRKNPFSIYDFLGYVFPGSITIYLLYFFYSTHKEISSVGDLIDSVMMLKVPSGLEETILLTVASYIVGHLIAYLSSVSVEFFGVWEYGYPSEFLLANSTEYTSAQQSAKGRCKYYQVRQDEKIWKKICRITFRTIIAVFLLPISLSTLIFNSFCGAILIKKPLDKYLANNVMHKCYILIDYLGLQSPSPKTDTDFHRVVYHYEFENMSAHGVKMDNYIALYGFLRAMAFVFNCVFLYVFVFIAVPSITWGHPINWAMIVLLLSLNAITYIFFLAFMKFYRRYTLESFMCLLTDCKLLSND